MQCQFFSGKNLCESFVFCHTPCIHTVNVASALWVNTYIQYKRLGWVLWTTKTPSWVRQESLTQVVVHGTKHGGNTGVLLVLWNYNHLHTDHQRLSMIFTDFFLVSIDPHPRTNCGLVHNYFFLRWCFSCRRSSSIGLQTKTQTTNNTNATSSPAYWTGSSIRLEQGRSAFLSFKIPLK